MKVLHGPVNVGNQPWALSRAERALGLDSEVVVAFQTWLNYGTDRVLTPLPYSRDPRHRWARLAFGIEASARYDVIHYYFGQSYVYRAGRVSRISFADLKLARRLGRRLFMTLQGCDVRRAGASNRRNAVTMCREGGCGAFAQCIAVLDEVRSQLVDEILPLCDRVFYLNPELGHEIAKPNIRSDFLPYASCDIRAIRPALPSQRKRPIILHAPSDRAIKGSDLIEATLQRLSSRFDFDYRAVTGVPHDEALQLYRDADLVIDQIQAGWYGGFAVEVMAMGKPVACYVREEDLAHAPAALVADLPVLRIDPRTLEADLGRILAARACWSQVGQRSRAFVERWHDPQRIAASLKRCYETPGAPLELDMT